MLLLSGNAWGQKLNPEARIMLANKVHQDGVTYPFKFAVISDSHVGCERPSPPAGPGCCGEEVRDCSCFDGLLDIFPAIERHDPMFVLSLGDFTECGRKEEYEYYRDRILLWMIANQIPVFTIPGNHDLPPKCNIWDENDGHARYEKYIDAVQYTDFYGVNPFHKFWDYSFDYGAFRFILVDNVQKVGTWEPIYEARITEAQLNHIKPWLEDAGPNAFVFTHYPIEYPGFLYPGYSNLNDLASEHGVRAAFAGHTHEARYEDRYDCDRYDHFQLPPGCPRINSPSGFFLVSVDNPSTDACGFYIEQYKYISGSDSWPSWQAYPPPALELTNKTVRSSCTYFGQAIETSGLTIEAPGDVEFVAGDNIVLLPGVTVQNGGKFSAYVRRCGNRVHSDGQSQGDQNTNGLGTAKP